MKMKSVILSCLCLIALTACLGSGGGGSGTSGGITQGDITHPTVVSVSPIGNDAPVSSTITAIFSEALDPSTVNTSTFTISGVSGTVAYSGTTAAFTPTAPLAPSTTYTATLNGMKDLSGNPMFSAYSWTFTTVLPDTVAPTISFTSSADPVTGAISVTFSEPMNPATVTATQFTLTQGSTPVTGTVSCSSAIATFTPATSLVPDLIYTATISTGVKDLAGNALALPYSWSFAGEKTVSGLSYTVIDAEYSKSLDKIIMVAAAPSNQLHIYDPMTGSDAAVTLGLSPTSVSVSPDGQFAAVGHNAWISYVNLSTATLVNTFPVAADVLDIILAGNGYVYAFPRIDQWANIHAINIATGAETLHTGMSIYAGTKAKLHPGGTSIYGANNGLSPADIEKYDISGGTPAYLYDSPYHGDYAMCGDLWISEDGLRIFTKCGNVFNSTSLQTTDMYYAGALQNLALVTHLSHSSAIGKIAAIPGVNWSTTTDLDTEVRVFGYQFLTLEQSIKLPHFVVGTSSYAGHGKFVFHNSNGTHFFVILQAEAGSGMLYDYGVVTY